MWLTFAWHNYRPTCVHPLGLQNAVSDKRVSVHDCVNALSVEWSSELGGWTCGAKQEAVTCHSWGSRLCPCSSGWCDCMMNRWEEVSGPSVLSVTSTLHTSGGDLWAPWRSSLRLVVFLWQHCGIFTHRDRMSRILGKHFGCDWSYPCCWCWDAVLLSGSCLILDHIICNIGNDKQPWRWSACEQSSLFASSSYLIKVLPTPGSWIRANYHTLSPDDKISSGLSLIFLDVFILWMQFWKHISL